MYFNLHKTYKPTEIKEVFEKYLNDTGVGADFELYKKLQEIKTDCEFFNAMIKRFGSKSPYQYEVRLFESGLIYNSFLQKINGLFNYYEHDLLLDYLYLYEVLKILFKEYWVDGVGINIETVEKIADFHFVVEYYMGMKDVAEYVSCFIGSSYGITEFKKAVSLVKVETETSHQ